MTAVPEIDWTDLEGATPAPTTQVNGRSRPDLPPHDTAAERAVLGACLLDPSLIDQVDQHLRDDDYYQPQHLTIWHALVDLHTAGQPVDPIAVWNRLQHDQAFLRAGGPLLLQKLVEDTPTAASATYYAQIVAQHGRARRWAALGTFLQQAARTGLDDAQIRERVEKRLGETRPGVTTTSSWAHVDLEHALAGIDEDPPALMPRTDGHCLLYTGAIHTLSGEPASGKTWLALQALVHELEAGNPAAVVDFEDRPARVVARLLRLGATPTQIRAQLRYIRPSTALDHDGRAALAQAVDGTTLCVIDGVTEAMTLHGLDLSSNPDVAAFYGLLPRWIADRGPTVLMIDHVVKDSEKQSRWGIGGQHKLAGIDGAAYTIRNVTPFGRGKTGHSRVFIAKDRHGHVEEHALGRCAAEFHLDSTDPNVSVARLEPPEAMPTTDGGDMRPTYLMEKVSRYVEINPGLSTRQISEAKLGKAAFVRRALDQLIAEGYVITETGPRNAVFHRSAEPFRRDQEQELPE